ncbi:ABC transporter ATP-binding protein [Leeia sp. TBRC 13508]|uniref:ABC transporter ATP-binding protein n=1 Tax=Leeia speluncae TaxID=2884804 RepID=A0ABS8D8I8_9NEIS|nr:ABC transporter ATP-binding protein [Leeia speluncae]MCB6184489.1 ABC transporter ATP-binding protein [Leeia speluncae]
MLTVHELSKTYLGATKPAVHQISFSLEKGDTLALLGPSGCGKTTVLRLLAGLELPDAGEISFAGTRLDLLSVANRKIGFVFQDYALFPHLTVWENVAFGLSMQGVSSASLKERVDNWLVRLRIADLAERYPNDISGGQQQRVAVARAMAPEPQLLLLDEPFSNLDAQLREDLQQQLRALLKGSGQTSIFVTHDQQEAFYLADQMLIMNEGLCVVAGVADDLYSQPKNEWVAGFLGHKNIKNATLWPDEAFGFDGEPTAKIEALHFQGNNLTVEVIALDERWVLSLSRREWIALGRPTAGSLIPLSVDVTKAVALTA